MDTSLSGFDVAGNGYPVQNFSLQEFGNAVGDTVTGFLENASSTLDANAINNLAIANLNKAQADAIRSNAENKKQITRAIFIVLIVAIIAVAGVSIAKKFIK